MSHKVAMAAIKAHIGEPPFLGFNAVADASKVKIVGWARAHGMTRHELADGLGISQTTLSKWKSIADGTTPRAKTKKRSKLKLTSESSVQDAIVAIQEHVGRPPFSGINAIPDASKLQVVTWAHAHSGMSLRQFSVALDIPIQTLNNWDQITKATQGASTAKADQPAKAPARPPRESIPAVKWRRRTAKNRPIKAEIIDPADGPTLVLPNGASITGLSLPDLVTVLRELTADDS